MTEIHSYALLNNKQSNYYMSSHTMFHFSLLTTNFGLWNALNERAIFLVISHSQRKQNRDLHHFGKVSNIMKRNREKKLS